jgi:hypothetical protein
MSNGALAEPRTEAPGGGVSSTFRERKKDAQEARERCGITHAVDRACSSRLDEGNVSRHPKPQESD